MKTRKSNPAADIAAAGLLRPHKDKSGATTRKKKQPPLPTIEPDKPTNPPHPEKGGTLWAQDIPQKLK